MKPLGTTSIALVLRLLAGAAVAFAAQSPAGDKPAWKISGTLEESCSCNAACPCWFGSKPTRSECSGGMALFIKKGTYGKTPLDGLGFAGFTQSPEGKSMFESMGDFKFNEIYIDEKANPEQRKALEAIALETMPLAKPENTHVHYTPVALKVAGAEHAVAVGGVGQWSGHLMSGGFKGTPKIVNPPGADPFHKEYLQGVTTKQSYDDVAHWNFENTNYMYTTFNVTSADMKQYAAAMEEMMKSMKH
jgi:hypothetical protein